MKNNYNLSIPPRLKTGPPKANIIAPRVLQGSKRTELTPRNAPNHKPAEPADVVVGTRIDDATAEVQIVSVAATADRRRPIAAVRTAKADRRTVDVAGIDKVVRISF